MWSEIIAEITLKRKKGNACDAAMGKGKFELEMEVGNASTKAEVMQIFLYRLSAWGMPLPSLQMLLFWVFFLKL